MFRVLDADSPISKEDFLQFEEILGKKLPEAMKDFLSQVQRWPAPSKGVFTMTIISFLSIPLIHLMR